MAAAAVASDPRSDEWDKARSAVDAADEHLSDLRKYGLSFIASLLTAQGITEVSVGQPNAYITPSVKLAITAASLLLILAMVILEKVDRSIQRAAALRARVIERQLGMELTEDITLLYRQYHVDFWIDTLYALFVVAAGGLGVAILNPTALNFAWETGADIGATIGVLALVLWIGFNRPVRMIDWSLDRYRVSKGNTVVLTLTNISPAPLVGVPGQDLWDVKGANPEFGLYRKWDGMSAANEPERSESAAIQPEKSHSWVIPTEKLAEGAYDIEVSRNRKRIRWWTRNVTLDNHETLPVPLVVTKP